MNEGKGRKASWIVKRYGKYGRKQSWIVKRYGKYRRKLWKDMKNRHANTYTYLPIYLHFYQNYRFYSMFASYFPILMSLNTVMYFM
jgi:hypothetical protein